jgi:hypothetical protein
MITYTTNLTMYKTLALMLAAAFAVAALTTTSLSVQSTDAQLTKDNGASFFAPGQSEAQQSIPGDAKDSAAGIERGVPASPPPEGNEVGWMPEGSTSIPGIQGLLGGIVGPD